MDIFRLIPQNQWNALIAATSANLANRFATINDIGVAFNMNTNRLLGRYNAGLGAAEEITIGSGLVLSPGGVLSASGTSYVFTSGLTELAGTVTNDFFTGKAGGQILYGGTAASENLTISSTANATKGFILVGATDFINIGAASTVGQKRLRIGSATRWLDIGETTGPSGESSLWMTQATPDNTNWNFQGGNTRSFINIPTATGRFQVRILNGSDYFIYDAGLNTSTWTPPASAVGNATIFKWVTPNNTNQTGFFETIGFHFDMSAGITHNLGGIPVQRDLFIQARVHNFASPSTIGSGGTLVISGPPTVSVGSIITNPYSIWSQSGAVFIENAASSILLRQHPSLPAYGSIWFTGSTNPALLGNSTNTIINATSGVNMQIGGSDYIVMSASAWAFQSPITAITAGATFNTTAPAAAISAGSFFSSNSTLVGNVSQNASGISFVHSGAGFNSSIYYGASIQNRSSGALAAGMGAGLLFGLGYGGGSFVNTKITSYAIGAVSSTLDSAFGLQTSIAGVVAERFTFYQDKFAVGVLIPTAYLHVKASTSSIPHMKLVAGVTLASPTTGDVWHDSTQKTTFSRYDVGSLSNVGFLTGATADSNTVSGTTTLTFITTNGHTATIPANSLAVGKRIRVHFRGRWSNQAVVGASLTVNFNIGNAGTTVLRTTGSRAFQSAGSTNRGFRGWVDLVILSVGAGGTVGSGLSILYQEGGAVTDGFIDPSNGTAAIDTTVSQLLRFSVQWGSNNAANSITFEDTYFEIIN